MKSSHGSKYTLNWIHKCILIRIKSKKTYEYLRLHDILSLPSIVTLDKYLANTKGMYGFQTSTLSCLNVKSKYIKHEEKRRKLI